MVICRNTAKYTATLRRRVPVVDPFRRRRVHRAARSLVGDKAWEGDATGRDIAGLCLLRSLWLAKETRRACQRGAREAGAMAARGALESTLVGLYALYVPEAADAFTADMGKSFLSVLGGPVIDSLNDGFLKKIRDQLGTNGVPRSMPAVVKAAIEAGGGRGLGSFPGDRYDPLSKLVVHTTPLSLARHVNYRNATTRRRPRSGPSTSYLVDQSEGSVGLLAAEIAGRGHPDYELFRGYAIAHLSRQSRPIFRLAVHLFFSQIRYRKLPIVISEVRKLWRSVNANVAITEQMVKPLVEALIHLTGDPGLVDTDTMVQAILSYQSQHTYTNNIESDRRTDGG